VQTRNEGIHHLICMVLLSALLSCEGEKGFIISGNVNGFADSSMIYLKSWSTGDLLDSAWIKNHQFTLKGKINSAPDNLLLYTSENGKFTYTNLLIGNEEVNLSGNIKDFPWNVNVTGSPSHNVLVKIHQINYQKELKKAELDIYLDALPDSIQQVEKEMVQKKKKAFEDAANNQKIAFIKNNFNSYAALVHFKYHKNSFNQDTLLALYNQLPEELKQTKYGKAINMQLNYPAPEIGDDFYDFSAFDIQGNEHTLSEITNKYVLLHFSHAACFPSIRSLVELKKIYEKHQDSISIVKFSLDLKKEDWIRSVERDSIPWLNLWDGKGDYSPAVVKYGTIGTPHYFLISPGRKVVSKWFGYEKGMIEDEIRKMPER